MTSLIKWNIFCITEQAFFPEWSQTQPTTCPNNTGHSIGQVWDIGAESRHIYSLTTTTNNTFTVTQNVFFAGSNYEGDLSLIRAVCKVGDGTGKILIFDVTNNSQIAVSNEISNTSYDTIVFPSFSNVPTQGAIWQIQLIKDTGVEPIYCDCLILSF